jgi:hypothetical protein
MMVISTKHLSFVAAAIGLTLPLTATAATIAEFGNTTVSAGGYIKLDAIYTDWSDGKNASQIHQDFYLPSGTSVGDGSGSERDFDINARATRVNLKTSTVLENGENLTTFFETDLYGGGGNQVVSNSANPRLRHAYLSYGDWTFGQTWSTFMNLGAYPETLDFVGPSDGIAFIRQGQIRYTRGNLQFALENPETTVSGAGATDEGTVPDLVIKYSLPPFASLAAVVRQLSATDVSVDVNGNGTIEAGETVDDKTLGMGLSASGRIELESGSQVNVMFNMGAGMGRYTGLGVAPDAWIDDGVLRHIITLSGYVGYKRHWTDKWRSNLVYSFYRLGDTRFQDATPTATSATNSTHLNLLYSPTKKVTFGGELLSAKRTLASGLSGTQMRVQVSAKVSF